VLIASVMEVEQTGFGETEDEIESRISSKVSLFEGMFGY
jgi:hypothetical protein